MCRWEHEEVMDELRKRMKNVKGRRLMAMRKEIVEHPFGTMKRAFNMRRVINIKGVSALIKAIGGNKQQLRNAIGASPNI